MHSESKIRSQFLQFFEKHDHKIVKSAPLIPQNDESLLFINAGMAPLKEYFLGQKTPPTTNLTSCQKCIRAGGKHNDLDQVGYTKRHHTFFEMLGNFSFGGYRQKTAIELAWEFLTKELNLSIDRLWVTVHPDDSISKEIWSEIVSKDRIVELSENEWSMGGDGPCGMCTEIFFDHGDHIPGTIEDGDRFVEIWNIVFMTHQVKDGIKSELPKICIDTGMGLERIAAVLSGTEDNYKAPLFYDLIQQLADLTQHEFCPDFKIIADHARAAAFAIADGILPDVSGRGYVIRKIIRRALVHAYGYADANHKTGGLVKLAANYMIDRMGADYPELNEYRDLINITLDSEKTATDEILNNATSLVQKFVKQDQDMGDMVPGETLFMLHDTYGVPVEVTEGILEKMGLKANVEEYNTIVEERKEKVKIGLPVFDFSTEFVGYDHLSIEATLLDKMVYKDETILVFDQTPFYAESGGQESDTGKIMSENSEISVSYVKKSGNTILHFCDANAFEIATVGHKYTLKVDSIRRNNLAKHHSATHLLLKALRLNLGDHVIQKGSSVKEDGLRFDFLHASPVAKETLAKIEKEVNEWILDGHASSIESMSQADARDKGAVATFGEKYGEVVRVVELGPSIEFCGGTHVKNTGDIGSFYILKERGISGGVRRIEAVAGIAAYEYARTKIDLISRLANGLRVQEEVLENVVLQKQEEVAQPAESSFSQYEIGDFRIAYGFLQNHKPAALLKLGDDYLEENDFVFLANVNNGKTNLMLKTKTSINMVEILQNIITHFGGKGGGGRTDMAQGGLPSEQDKNALWDSFISQLKKSLDSQNMDDYI